MTVTETVSSRQFSTTRCQRIVVVGTTGSGKTTLARSISERLAVPHVELDALFWGPNWTPVPVEDFWRRIAQGKNRLRNGLVKCNDNSITCIYKEHMQKNETIDEQ